ncbi:gp53-like domain-containing protein [Pseudomonas simiae]|uniref:gp53-like domain-containing protein n=1 Tax=Pseudomonas simiae TaxID=321846 RepID=UPI0040591418
MLGDLLIAFARIGYGTETHSDTGFRFFPMAFPTAATAMVAMANFAHGSSTWVLVPDRSKYLMGLGPDYVNGSATNSLFWIAIGY